MPKVKFLKDLFSGRAGSIHDLQDYEANVLIKLKVAEIYDESKSSIENSVLLLNKDGTPVVDNFGSLIEVQPLIENIEKKRKKKQI